MRVGLRGRLWPRGRHRCQRRDGRAHGGNLLDSLVRKSLVIMRPAMGRARYSMLETIRQFAEDELAAMSAIDAARDRHAAYYGREATARWEQWSGPGCRHASDWLEIEI